MDRLFNGHRFDREGIVVCVRWYLNYKLSQRFTPEFAKRWDRFAKSAGRSWRVDETLEEAFGYGFVAPLL
ncbi:hypothetical protein CI15_25300 [Paraburkholderia monticola]|uniref:Transposase n=1 Tax=Paraburkholderia monticola TaxID=1399968 RepID=A0A149PFP8_9BURK|nr:hypothetical protein CI15_25300 [Paraburkholderia monticola]